MRISLSTAAVPAAIITVGAIFFIFFPETPSSLIQRTNDNDRARRPLQRVRGTSEVQSELSDLIEASQISNSIHNSFTKILQTNYRSQLVMAVMILFFHQVNLINFIASKLRCSSGRSGSGRALLSCWRSSPAPPGSRRPSYQW
ncbi:unnamed protein product [Linum tenue]|uniref:Uncharacterized protein n=1 Tax=Linum tenue TaxID=586396 RepID=A0AAV0P140_9ROSI|nr:unnamed protein product [Linum tenue]